MTAYTDSDTLIVDYANLSKWSEQSSYNYGRDFYTSDISPATLMWQKLMEWLGMATDKVDVPDYSDKLIILISIVILIGVIAFVIYRRPSIFATSGKKALNYTISEDTIHGIDFAAAIEEAICQMRYSDAVRLIYLQTLNKLSEAGRINWQLHKTPTQYTYEVTTPEFRSMTLSFIRVRYGNYDADEKLCCSMQQLQTSILGWGEI